MLEWTIDNDADGDRQHVIVTIEQTGGGITHVLDSRATPSLFEFNYSAGAGWQTVSQTGVSPNPNASMVITT